MPARAPFLAACLLLAIIFRPALAAGSDGPAACPGYRAALQEARTALDRGARTEAVAALERAKAALAICRRREANRHSVVGTATRVARHRLDA